MVSPWLLSENNPRGRIVCKSGGRKHIQTKYFDEKCCSQSCHTQFPPVHFYLLIAWLVCVVRKLKVTKFTQELQQCDQCGLPARPFADKEGDSQFSRNATSQSILLVRFLSQHFCFFHIMTLFNIYLKFSWYLICFRSK